MAYGMGSGFAACEGYKNNAVAGLADRDMLLKGIHGIVIHIKLAMIVSVKEEARPPEQRAQHLAAADRLVAFMIGITDRSGAFGHTLLNCYTGLQQLISRALFAPADEVEQALSEALEQARALEASVSQALGVIKHD
jgi:hypothetical protein